MLPHRKLNLFAFSSETNTLFNLLMLASVMLSLFLGNALGLIIGLLFGVSNLFNFENVTSLGVDLSLASLPSVCLSGFSLFAMLGFAFFLYHRHPAQIRKRRKTVPLSDKDSSLYDEVNMLAIEAGVKTPSIEITQGLKGTDAQAFGVGGKHSLALDGGLRILRKTKPNFFKALIRHELAHIANEDIGRSYFSDALWKSVKWILVPLFALIIIIFWFSGFIPSAIDGDLINYLLTATPTVIKLVFQFTLTIALAGIIWALLLRTREYFADWKAALWDSDDSLRAILNENEKKEKPASSLNFWKNHPSARERIAALNQPLFSFSWAIIFFGGLLLAFIFSGIIFEFKISLLFNGIIIEFRNASSGLLFVVARIVSISTLVITFITIQIPVYWLLNRVILPQIQKQTIHNLIHNQRGIIPYLKLAFPAFVFVAGLEIGFFVTPFDIYASNDLSGIVIELLLIIPLIGCLVWGYFSFIRFFALRLIANQIGQTFSIWRTRFLEAFSIIWAFLFFIPGLTISPLLTISRKFFEYYEIALPIILGWMIFTLLLSPLFFITTWGIVKVLFDKQTKKCPNCGKVINQAFPVLKQCESCQKPLGEWLFVSKK